MWGRDGRLVDRLAGRRSGWNGDVDLEADQVSSRVRSFRPPEICLFEEALPGELFERLVRAVRAIGREGLKRTYKSTFWFARDAEPANIVEESIVELLGLVGPVPECVGMEWWLGRLSYGKGLSLHFDRDLTLSKETGRYVHPQQASVLYLNAFPSSPTVILDQVPAPDGRSKIPEEPKLRTLIDPVPNHYVVFSGNLRHGVVAIPDRSQLRSASTRRDGDPDLRLSLLVNYWDRRPLPPMGADFDGTIYGCLRDQVGGGGDERNEADVL